MTALRRFLLCLALLAAAPAWAAPVQGYEVVKAYPHDPQAFTQGLFFKDGVLFESTGLYGGSSIRRVALETGEVLQGAALPSQVFGEGLTWWDDRLINITWTSGVGFVVDMQTFALRSTFEYPGEGWGLARSDSEILMSDGTAEIRRLDPQTLAEHGRFTVTDEGRPVDQLNELEWVKGELWANVWQTDRIARIDPASGEVTGWIDLSGLLDRARADAAQADVLNGIAYDEQADRVFVTGKLWPELYEIRLKPAP